MRSLTIRGTTGTLRALRLGLVVAALTSAVAVPAKAMTWGHLRGPFATESIALERANLAAQQRAETRLFNAPSASRGSITAHDRSVCNAPAISGCTAITARF